MKVPILVQVELQNFTGHSCGDGVDIFLVVLVADVNFRANINELRLLVL